jgi:predicted CXXCH cytochrome family protein
LNREERTELSILGILAEKGGEKMKKALMILGGVLLLTLGAVGMASANAGPHGNFGGGASTPDGCAGCHRAHTAIGPYVLAAESPDALCELCHGSTGNTDVFDGILTSNNAQLNGGGFVRMGGTTQSGSAVQSKHDIEGLGGTTMTAWGSGSSGLGAEGRLECVSCHNPHGSTNYRILNDSGKWVNNSKILSFAQNQVLTNTSGNFAEPSNDSKYAPGSWDALSNTYYQNGINAFCSSCHQQYAANGGAYSRPSNTTAVNSAGEPYYWYGPATQDIDDGEGDLVRYRHSTSRTSTSDQNINRGKTLRFATTSNASTIRGVRTCLTCHFAHGTTATAGTLSANASPAGDSANLLYDNRGVCQACHKIP